MDNRLVNLADYINMKISDRRKIIECLKRGISPTVLSEDYDVSMNIIREWIHEEKILQSKKITHNGVLRLHKRYMSGGIPKELAESVNITTTDMYDFFKRLGLKVKKERKK